MLSKDAYWHISSTRNYAHDMSDTPIKVGQKFKANMAVMCRMGFHGSKKLEDAMYYSSGFFVSIRKLTGSDMKFGGDKVCATQMEVLAFEDCREIFKRVLLEICLDSIRKYTSITEVVEVAEYLANATLTRSEVTKEAQNEFYKYVKLDYIFPEYDAQLRRCCGILLAFSSNSSVVFSNTELLTDLLYSISLADTLSAIEYWKHLEQEIFNFVVKRM